MYNVWELESRGAIKTNKSLILMVPLDSNFGLTSVAYANLLLFAGLSNCFNPILASNVSYETYSV